MAQSYTLRASFFTYLRDQFGDAPVLAMAYGAERASVERYEAVFGNPFDTLVAAWRADLLAQFQDIPQAAEQADAYRTTTPVQNWRICQQGVDF